VVLQSFYIDMAKKGETARHYRFIFEAAWMRRGISFSTKFLRDFARWASTNELRRPPGTVATRPPAPAMRCRPLLGWRNELTLWLAAMAERLQEGFR